MHHRRVGGEVFGHESGWRCGDRFLQVRECRAARAGHGVIRPRRAAGSQPGGRAGRPAINQKCGPWSACLSRDCTRIGAVQPRAAPGVDPKRGKAPGECPESSIGLAAQSKLSRKKTGGHRSGRLPSPQGGDGLWGESLSISAPSSYRPPVSVSVPATPPAPPARRTPPPS